LGLLSYDVRMFLDPSVQRSMINIDAALGHDFFENPIRYCKPNIEIDRIQDHRFRVVCAFETDQSLEP
jgi:hypothetical protein